MSNKTNTDHLKVPVQRIGKDEMNLAEFPFSLLSKRVPTCVETIEFSDMVLGKDRTPVKREWIVTGSNRFGLPRAGDEELYVALMKLTKDSGLENRTVNFTRYKLVQTMGWSNQGKNYKRIEEGLKRLKGVSIYAKNAFWDNDIKSYANVSFGIIDNFVLYDEPTGRNQELLPLSNFSWNEILFHSFQSGFIKNLDVDFYFNLDNSIARRLYRFLDKNKYCKSQFEIGLSKLSALLPVHDKYPSQVKRRLESSHKELIDKGFLSSAVYKQSRSGEEKVIYSFSKALSNKIQIDGSAADSSIMSKNLKERGITGAVAETLVNSFPIEQIQKQIEIFDLLKESKSPLIGKNPAGFLRKSIEENYEPPADYLKWQKRETAKQEREQAAIEKEAEQVRLDEIQQQVDEYRDRLGGPERDLLRQEAMELIESDKAIKQEFVSELLIRAKEAEIVKKRLGIQD